MSGGQFSVPIVIRMATGAGRQLAAQHAHSLEGWLAHIPGIRVVTPATIDDARGMLWTALEDPDPVLIFEPQTLYNMEGCRDGLMPERLATVNARYGTPALLTLALGGLIAVLAAFVPLGEIVELVNIGTLFAFVLVNIGVIVLRRTRPDMPRPYRVPLSPIFPLLGIAFAIYLMADLPLTTWIRFVVWLVVGILIYLLYGYRHSRVRRLQSTPAGTVSTEGTDPRGESHE
jgi:hypothetical protein